MKTQLTCLSLILSVNLFSQSKIPLDFFGLNAWMPDEYGNTVNNYFCHGLAVPERVNGSVLNEENHDCDNLGGQYGNIIAGGAESLIPVSARQS